jgi:hypothetical protein
MYAIDRGFGGSLLGEPVIKDEGRYGAAARETRWIDALAFQYGKAMFMGKVWQEEEGVRTSMVVE